MDRVDEFLGDRLRGRSVPEDLRRLVELQLDGVLQKAVPPFSEIRLLRAGELHPLEEPLEPVPDDPHPDETRANIRAVALVLSHVAPVAGNFDGSLWGYWLHPDEPADRPPAILRHDTEGQFEIVNGGTLIEAMIFHAAGDEDPSEAIAFCDQHGIPLAARSSEDLATVRTLVEPAALQEKLFKLEHPYHRRPAWADEPGAAPDPAPLAANATDARVGRALSLHGLPDDPSALIRAADEGIGEVVLRSSSCTAELEFHRENDTSWFLHEMRFSAGSAERATCTHVPFGLSFDETREQCNARFGEPVWKSPIGAMEQWRFGRVDLHVRYKNDKPRAVRCKAALGKD